MRWNGSHPHHTYAVFIVHIIIHHSIFLPNTCTSSFLASFLPHSLFTSIHGMCWESDRNAYHRQWIYDGRRRIHHQPEEVDNLIQWNSHSGSPKTHVVQHAAHLKTFFPLSFRKFPHNCLDICQLLKYLPNCFKIPPQCTYKVALQQQ